MCPILCCYLGWLGYYLCAMSSPIPSSSKLQIPISNTDLVVKIALIFMSLVDSLGGLYLTENVNSLIGVLLEWAGKLVVWEENSLVPPSIKLCLQEAGARVSMRGHAACRKPKWSNWVGGKGRSHYNADPILPLFHGSQAPRTGHRIKPSSETAPVLLALPQAMRKPTDLLLLGAAPCLHTLHSTNNFPPASLSAGGSAPSAVWRALASTRN